MPQGNVRQLRGIATSEPTRGRRWKTKWAARLHTAAAQMPCTVLDVSIAGAKLRIDHALDEGNAVSLFIGNKGAISARVVWRHDDSVGLCFVEEQPWIVGLIPHAESDRLNRP